MEVIYSLHDIKKVPEPTTISLGTFDGLHKGHTKLLNALVENSKKNGFTSIVYTFSNHPRNITIKDNSPKMIMTNNQKIVLFKSTDIDKLLLVPFDELHRSIRAEDFVKKILIDKLNMKSMVVGFDCKFGKNAEGNLESLNYYSKKYNFELQIVNPLKIDNNIVSSTLIRKYLTEGNIEKVNFYLGRSYNIEGKVIKGKQLGKKLGFPTANIIAEPNLCLPKPGVYITRTYAQGLTYHSITNVGYNPTFDEKKHRVETYIFDYDGNLYDNKISVEFLTRIRDELKFNSIDDLCSKVNSDLNYAKSYFENQML